MNATTPPQAPPASPAPPAAPGRSGDKIGYLEGIGCYVIWGSLPIFWNLLSAVSALEVLAWRMAGCCVFMVLLCSLVRRTRFLHLFRDARALRTFTVSGLLITLNWGLYVWSVSNGHTIEASIGYYLCPFCNIILGRLVFGERLTPAQKLATGLALAGVAYFIVVNFGAIWISLVLAVSFAAYGAVKKRGAYPALPGMAFESLLTGGLGAVMLAIGAVVPQFWQLTPALPHAIAATDPAAILVLLCLSGVMTGTPLLLYSAAANRITMTMIGFFQYISPSIAIVIAVALLGEPFTFAHGVCLGLIWVGIAAVAVETGVAYNRRNTEGRAAADAAERPDAETT